jgi:hypothetical protein
MGRRLRVRGDADAAGEEVVHEPLLEEAELAGCALFGFELHVQLFDPVADL